MKLAYVTTYDASDVHAWSGAGYHIARTLESAGMALDYVGDLQDRFSWPLRGKKLLYRFLGKRHLWDREPALLRGYARQVAASLRGLRTDIVFSPGTLPICYLDVKQPIVFWTDATFAGMVDYYPEFSNLTAESVRHGNLMEQAALDRCDLAIYTSDWAARTALEHYAVPEEKIKVVPFGANVNCNRTAADIERLVESRPGDRCRLLFVGVDWKRKGGDTAVAVARSLNRLGLPTELHLLGCEVPGPLPDFVRQHGFLSKRNQAGLAAIERLFSESHFLILPSRAECNANVFAEACSFGLPILSTRTGGITTSVRDGINGRTFALDARPFEWSSYVFSVVQQRGQYRELALGAFNEYRVRLNWDVAGRTVRSLIEQTLG